MLSSTLSVPTSSPQSLQRPSSLPTKSRSGTRDRVTELVEELSQALRTAVHEIHSVNSETKVLALNARIESARAGQFGAAFGIVAQEMQELSERTSQIANSMATGTQNKTHELLTLINTQILGSRLSDQALMNIDLIDRCLYERTCDVRWWATDKAIVDALTTLRQEDLQYAVERMGVILNAYTVYYDLVVCDAKGTIVANGRPNQFKVLGKDESHATWFQSAMATQSGDQFGFQSACKSPLVQNQDTIIYSAAIRENADSHGKSLGALGILFNWQSLSSAILQKVADREPGIECYILDENEKVLAASVKDDRERFRLHDLEAIRSSPRGHFQVQRGGKSWCVAYAKAPGFETYSTGWYSLVIQALD